MNFFKKLGDFVAPPESEGDEAISMSEEFSATSSYETVGKKGVTQMNAETKMILFEPRTFEECEDVANHLMQRRAAVLNLHRLPVNFQQRIIDFLHGVVYALHGSIQMIGHNVYLFTPNTIGVSGEINLEIDDER